MKLIENKLHYWSVRIGLVGAFIMASINTVAVAMPDIWNAVPPDIREGSGRWTGLALIGAATIARMIPQKPPSAE